MIVQDKDNKLYKGGSLIYLVTRYSKKIQTRNIHETRCRFDTTRRILARVNLPRQSRIRPLNRHSPHPTLYRIIHLWLNYSTTRDTLRAIRGKALTQALILWNLVVRAALFSVIAQLGISIGLTIISQTRRSNLCLQHDEDNKQNRPI